MAQGDDNYKLKFFKYVEMAFDYYKEIVMVLLSLVVLFLAGMSFFNVLKMLYNGIFYHSPELYSKEFAKELMGGIFTVLIAFEFEETFLSGFHDEGNRTTGTIVINHICPVILIGILAIIRHILTIDFEGVQLIETISMGGLLLVLGVVYGILVKATKPDKVE